jgi:hypothetical protein
MPRSLISAGIEVTTVPGAGASVSGPTASTSPEYSWPMNTSWPRSSPSVRLGAPTICPASSTMVSLWVAKWRSPPHTPHASTRISTWPVLGTGTGTSSRKIIEPLRSTEARMGFPLSEVSFHLKL